jgi:hypothetical protein
MAAAEAEAAEATEVAVESSGNTVNLSVAERLVLLPVLPEQGNLLTIRIVREMREDLSFTEEEMKSLAIRENKGQVVWNVDGEARTDFVFKAQAKKIVLDALKDKDEKGEVTATMISLFDKFVFPETD